MSLPSSRLSYSDCYPLMDQALKDPTGVRTLIGDKGEAKHFRLRLNNARLLERKINKQTYDPTHPLHDASEYDELVFRVLEDTEGRWWVYLEKKKPPEVVESLEVAPITGEDLASEPAAGDN